MVQHRLVVAFLVIVVVLVGPLSAKSNDESEDVSNGGHITLNLKDVRLVEALKEVAKQADINILIEPGFKDLGGVTVELNEVPLGRALGQILSPHNLTAEKKGEVWIISGSGVAKDRRLPEPGSQA